MWLNLNWTLKQVHLEIFKYIKYFFEIQNEEYQAQDAEAVWTELFKDMKESADAQSYWNWGEDENKSPYSVQIVNPEKKSFYAPACRFCGEKKCNNCPLFPEEVKTL